MKNSISPPSAQTVLKPLKAKTSFYNKKSAIHLHIL